MTDLTYNNNPYSLFGPSQWSNPYSAFNTSAIPPASYAGWPTDAMGNPIQMPAGMTLNQTPGQPQAPAAQPQAAAQAPSGGITWNGNTAMNSSGQRATQPEIMQNVYSQLGYQPVYGQMGRVSGQQIGVTPYQAPVPQPPQQAAAPAAPVVNNAGLTAQQYLQLRANPGRVTTPGATVPQAASSAQPGPGVLQAFLQNWKPAASGPGAGFQQSFNSALRGMGY